MRKSERFLVHRSGRFLLLAASTEDLPQVESMLSFRGAGKVLVREEAAAGASLQLKNKRFHKGRYTQGTYGELSEMWGTCAPDPRLVPGTGVR